MIPKFIEIRNSKCKPTEQVVAVRTIESFEPSKYKRGTTFFTRDGEYNDSRPYEYFRKLLAAAATSERNEPE